jgi:hypothetical protein
MNAAQMAPFAKNQAKAMFPQAFEGLGDAEVDQIVYGGIQSGIIAPDVATNPNGWAMAAWQLKGQKMGFNPVSPPPQSMQATPTESPSRPQNQDEGMEKPKLDELGRTFLSRRPEGMTEEDFLKLMQKVREEA